MEKNLSATLLSDEYGISTTTIQRWIERFKLYSEEDPEEKRQMTGVESELLIGITISATLKYLKSSHNAHITKIPESLVSKGAFEIPEFGVFLLWIYRFSSLVISDSKLSSPNGGHYISDEEFWRIVIAARLMLMTIPFKGTNRKEAEVIISDDDTTLFLRSLIDNFLAITTKQ